MPADISFSFLDKSHLPALAPVAAAAPDPWREEDLLAELTTAGHTCYVALQNGQPVAFASFALSSPQDAELLQCAVAPALRRQGLGRALLAHALRQLAAAGATRCLLDVRASNAGALALYTRLGFRPLAQRPRLYTHPIEDGVTLQLYPLPSGNPL